jgi:hypothetical protein
MARQATPALSKKRYAATVSPQPLQALGLAVGSAANRSINIFARFFGAFRSNQFALIPLAELFPIY